MKSLHFLNEQEYQRVRRAMVARRWFWWKVEAIAAGLAAFLAWLLT